MPQEPSCAGGCAAHPDSKNAKEKSNAVSLLSRTKVHMEQKTNGRNSCCSSEKDSGYSGKTYLSMYGDTLGNNLGKKKRSNLT